MTPQEVIDIMDDVTWEDNGRHYGKIVEARNKARDALEKQIPKKPEESYDGYADGNPVIDYHCPNCNREVDELEHHCECGQALDWGD